MKYDVDLEKISRAYYNSGLERARVRDLSGAAGYLKKSLRFDKYCTEARNLLGLIFYEMGETADALIQWIISLNLEPQGNKADEYLGEIQRQPAVLYDASETVKRFNNALKLAKSGAGDFAMVELQDITRKKPNYIKAQLLLAILYMQQGNNIKAGAALVKVLDIDTNHPQATILMQEVKKATGRAEVERARLENAFFPQKLEDEMVIIPAKKAWLDSAKTMIYLGVGLILGLLAFYLLILPKIRMSYNYDLNENIIQNSRQLSEVNADYQELISEHESLQADYDEVSARLDAYEKQNMNFTTTYETLNSILADCNNSDYIAAAEKYVGLDRENITSEPLQSQLQEVDRIMLNTGFTAVMEEGTNEWNGGNIEQAETYYRLALSINPDDPECMFLLGRLLQTSDRISEANAIFDQIVGEHPESPYAERAMAARGY